MRTPAQCIENPVTPGSFLLPGTAVVVIVVVLAAAVALTLLGLPLESVVAVLAVASTAAVGIIRRTAAVFAAHRV
ncbi:hypothetical protein [Streptomyces hiroshimensis]|nr:hypothetical protein [Streptomyces hiroshimensis]